MISLELPALGKVLVVRSLSPRKGNRKKLAALLKKGPITLTPLGACCNSIKYDEHFPYSVLVSVCGDSIRSSL